MKVISFKQIGQHKTWFFDTGHIAYGHNNKMEVFRDKIKLKESGKGYGKVVHAIIEFMKKDFK